MMAVALHTGESNKTRRAILNLLKTEGPANAVKIARRLKLTAMAVRQHLYELHKENFVAADERAVPVGRPAKYWRLTRQADRLFPEAYAELSLSLIDAVASSFGGAGIRRVLSERQKVQLEQYLQEIPPSLSLKDKVKRLAQIRTREGYMAEARVQGKENFLLIENHCPICAAASACKGFCVNELELFRAVVGPGVMVERVEHILSGNRRCAYRLRRA